MTMEEYSEIIFETENHLAIITLNQPSKYNAFDLAMLEEWEDALLRAKADDDVWVIMLTGMGKSFCSGVDMSLLVNGLKEDQSLADMRDFMRQTVHRIARTVNQLDKPYIAAVNGPAVGAGMDMANMADIRICSDKAKFVMGYVNMGIVPGNGGAYYLPRIVGLSRAYEMIWSGETVAAQTAKEIGLVNHILPFENFRASAIDYCNTFINKPPIALQLSKRAIKRGLETNSLDVTLEYSEWYLLITSQTEDAKEGPRAWLEKREPRFKGR